MIRGDDDWPPVDPLRPSRAEAEADEVANRTRPKPHRPLAEIAEELRQTQIRAGIARPRHYMTTVERPDGRHEATCTCGWHYDHSHYPHVVTERTIHVRDAARTRRQA